MYLVPFQRLEQTPASLPEFENNGPVFLSSSCNPEGPHKGGGGWWVEMVKAVAKPMDSLEEGTTPNINMITGTLNTVHLTLKPTPQSHSQPDD